MCRNLINSLIFNYYFLLVIICVNNANAACPTIYFAQAISQAKASSLQIYSTKTGIEKSSDCADICGLGALCQTAVYNHDAYTCQLSYEQFIECSNVKQRYNTFHLKTDGADALSVLTCIDSCAKKSDITKRVENTSKNNNNSKNLPANTSDLKTLFSHSENNEFTGLNEQFIQSKNQIAEKPIHHLHPIIPVNHPNPSIMSVLDVAEPFYERKIYSSNGKSSFERSGVAGRPLHKQSLREIVENNVKIVDANKMTTSDEAQLFLRTVQQLNLLQDQLANLHKNAGANDSMNNKNNLNRNELIAKLKSPKNVNFRAEPLTIQELFHGMHNAQEAQNHNNNDHSNHQNRSDFNNEIQKNEESKVRSGGFAVVLLPKKETNEQYDESVVRQNTTDVLKNSVIAKTKIKVLNQRQNEHETAFRSSPEKKTESPELTEPIVINGKILSNKEKAELWRAERSSSTTTTTVAPWQPAGLIGESSINEPESVVPSENTNYANDSVAKYYQYSLNNKKQKSKDNGFLNTFVISGLSTMGKNSDEIENNHTLSRMTQTTQSPTTSASSGPIICFRSIAQQCLIHATFKVFENIDLNECRCACAESWKPNSSERYHCKSLQYDEKLRKCTLNKADHNGKYDLIYNKHVDYYYVSCQIQQLLTTAEKKCNLNEKTTAKIPEVNSITNLSATTIQPSTTEQSTTQFIVTTTITEKPTPKQNSTATTIIVKPTISATKSVDNIKTTTQKSTTIAGEKTTQTANRVNKVLREENTGTDLFKSSTLIAETNIGHGDFDQKKNKLINTKRTESSLLVFSKATKPVKTTTTPSTPQTKATTKTNTLTTAIKNLKVNKCFEIINEYAMNSTAGGLEHDVSMEECQCYCANSLASGRYTFQCTSATYYHKEKDCILNLANRESHPDVFVQNPAHNEVQAQITYLGLICEPEKAIEKNVNKKFQNGCQRNEESETSNNHETTALPSSTKGKSDNCFLELPSYVLEGTALAIETNVTVEQCKCFCVDSENRYGSMCQSLQYYFDSQTCLLNKENRITDPDRFTYNSGNNVMHSYFDYRCHVEKMTLSLYIEQVCQEIIQLSYKDLLSKEKPSSLTNIDDPTNKAQSSKLYEDLFKVAVKNEIKNVTSVPPRKTTAPDEKISKNNRTKSLKKTSVNTIPLKTTTILPKTEVTQTEKIAKISTTTDSFENDSEEDSDEEKSGEDVTLITTSLPLDKKINDKNLKSEEYDDDDDDDEDDVDITTKQTLIFTKDFSNENQPKKTLIPELEDSDESIETTTKSQQTIKSVEVANKSLNKNVTKQPKPISNTTQSSSEITTVKYPNVGPCRYSALYQTLFNGVRLIKRVSVTSPAECFAACHAERCRSANLIQMEGNLKYCELFKDSIVDFRRTDVLGFDRGAVHFDSIQCDSS